MNSIKREIISELQGGIEKHFQNELSVFKAKCEELVFKPYANNMVHIEKLEKEIKSNDRTQSHTQIIWFILKKWKKK